MLNKKFFTVLLLCLCISIVFVGTVQAQSASPSPSPSSSPTPTATPIVIPNSNETNPTPTPTPNNGTNGNVTYVIVNGNIFQSINPNGNPLTIPLFTPAIITLNYATSNNYTITPLSVPDANHNEAQAPYFMSAYLSGVGTYSYRFWVQYDQVVNQTVTLTGYTQDQNASQIPVVIPLSILNKGFYLDVSVVCTVAPHPATPEELAQAQADLTNQLVMNVTEDTNATKFWTTTTIVVLVIVLVVVIAVVVILFKHVRRTDIELMRQATYGYNGRPSN